MKSFIEWMDDKVFPPRPAPLQNQEGKQTMIRVERHSKYTPKKGLDGGDIFFFDTWEEALEWMRADYYENSGGWSMTRDERVEFNREHGVHYKTAEEFGNAESHMEFGY